jgi:hypothetical protein
MSKQHPRARGQRNRGQQTFPVTIDGHKIAMTREQVIGNGVGWIRCHGEYAGQKVESLSIKQIGDKAFIKDKGRLAAYDIAEIMVALPQIKALIEGTSASGAASQ